MDTTVVESNLINPGICDGQITVLTDPLSFWGGFDPIHGTIIDKHHPQSGLCLTGKIVIMPGSRGSGGGPAGIAESIRRGSGPLGFVVPFNDVALVIGTMVAAKLYDIVLPVAVVDTDQYEVVSAWSCMQIYADGRLCGQ
jgi:uncharacterized protein